MDKGKNEEREARKDPFQNLISLSLRLFPLFPI